MRTDQRNFDHCAATGKRQYRTPAKAFAYAKVIGRKNRRNGDKRPVHAFRCEACGFHHIGHTAPSRPVPARSAPRKHKAPLTGTARAIDQVIFNYWSQGCRLIALGQAE